MKNNKSFYIKLHAINPKNNVNRTYEIILEKGLFNSFIVLVGWGRYNKGGQQAIYSFDNEDEAVSFIHQKIHKRLHAHPRIGCNYEIVYQNGTV